MKRSSAISSLILAAAGTFAVGAPAAQAADAAPATTLPNWEGSWTLGPDKGAIIDKGTGKPMWVNRVPWTPEWKKKAEKIDDEHLKNSEIPSNEQLCLPYGFPMSSNHPTEFYFSPKRVTIVTPFVEVRRVWTDGRPHTPQDKLKRSFMGESIGHWEGDTLVIDTVGLMPGNEMFYGMPLTDMHVIERIKLTGPDKLLDSMTFIDAGALTQPWVWDKEFSRHADIAVLDTYCEIAFDRSVDHQAGDLGFNLTPPKD